MPGELGDTLKLRDAAERSSVRAAGHENVVDDLTHGDLALVDGVNEQGSRSVPSRNKAIFRHHLLGVKERLRLIALLELQPSVATG